MRLAVIDVGTNTVRLLVAESEDPPAYRSLLTAQTITRLGQGLLPTKVLQPEPIRRTLEVLRRFRELAEAQGAARIIAVGTSALRDAENRTDFTTAARGDTGVDITVIPGEEEARLALLGVRAGLPEAPARLLMMDIGGGSTELLLADGEAIRAAVSTDLGAVRLTEALVHGDPPMPAELESVQRTAVERFEHARLGELRDLADVDAFVGTAGTVTSLAAVDLALVPYDPSRVAGHRLTRDRVARWLQGLAALRLEDRRQVPGLEPARADIIVAGIVVCLAAMDVLGFPALTVSDAGLREGILLDALRPSPAAARTGDRRSDSGADA